MNILNFSNNVIKLRHKKNITQEQLADFIGVTKGSVSKWENGQTLPDILLLPKLATFFDTTIDELLGYESQLSKEQIQKTCHGLITAFADLPFEEALKESQGLVKKYYSCYPLLFQIACLWLNHFMLAEAPSRQIEILTDASHLCQHIISDCSEIGICEDTIFLKASIDLQLGNTRAAIEALEDILNPYRLSFQSDSLLIQAYVLSGQKETAESFTQMSMYLHLLSLVSSSSWYLNIHSSHPDICEETIQRIEQIADAYNLSRLLPNAMALFCHQAAINYSIQEKPLKALEMLKDYAAHVNYLLTDDNLALHGDSYFSQIQSWYENLDLGAGAPRDKRIIRKNFLASLEHPAFSILEEYEEYQKLKKSLYTKGGEIS